MKVLILAGGYGTRISEETETRPKPMVEIGGKPILWHIMKTYSHYGYNEFVLLLGYKGYMIKEYFANYFLHQSDVTIDLQNNRLKIHNNTSEPWKVTLVDTGIETMTGGRIKKAQKYVGREPFLLTYGDGVADVDMAKLVAFHSKHGKKITMTSVQPEERFGVLDVAKSGQVKTFLEKPQGDSAWINAGFFVCQPEVFDYISGDKEIFEKKPLEKLAKEAELYTYKHTGFWHCMDTLRDKQKLNELWAANTAPWKIW